MGGIITIYPIDYFCPIDMLTGRLVITSNTRSIHRFAGSWESRKNKLRGSVYRWINRFFGKRVADIIRKFAGRRK